MSSLHSYPDIAFIRVSNTSAFERGKYIGKQTRLKVEHSLETYQSMFAMCDISWNQATEKAQAFINPIQQVSGELIDELSGIANGAGVDFNSVLALNCRTEILPADFLSRAYDSVGLTPGTTSPNGPHANECTSFAVARKNHPVWLVQNWDWCGRQREALCVVEQRNAKGLLFTTVTEAGMLAKIGLNAHGFGVTLNILRSANDGLKSGLPVHVFLRALLNHETVNDAIAFAQTLTFASSSNVMVADKNGAIASMELSPEGMRVINSEQNRICHTNHFLNNELAKNDVGRPGNESTINRLHRAQSLVSADMSLNDIKQLLCNTSDGLESICRFPDKRLPDIAQIETVTGVIMNLSTNTLELSAAQPSVSNFCSYTVGSPSGNTTRGEHSAHN